MTHGPPARTTYRPTRSRRNRIAVVFAALVVIAAVLGHHAADMSSMTATPTPALRAVVRSARSVARAVPERLGSPGSLPGASGALGVADGAVPNGTSVFDDHVPSVRRLDPALLTVLQQAAGAAAQDGVRFVVNSGWRSAAYEDQLRREAVAKYGSEALAARWVATGSTSPHVAGEAIDLGPNAAARWLAAHGAAYGLCRVYANEPWHFELRSGAISGGCPALYPDPTHDPRMQP